MLCLFSLHTKSILVLTTFLGLGTFQLHCCLCRVRDPPQFNQKYLTLCSEYKGRSYRFGMTQVINDRILILWRTMFIFCGSRHLLNILNLAYNEIVKKKIVLT